MSAFGQAPHGRGQRFPQNRFPPPAFNGRNQLLDRNANNENEQTHVNHQSFNAQSQIYGMSTYNSGNLTSNPS